jgi:hypothetical protein
MTTLLLGDTRIDGSPSAFEPHPVAPMVADCGCPTEKPLMVAATAVGGIAVAIPISTVKDATPTPDAAKSFPLFTRVPSQPGLTVSVMETRRPRFVCS